MAIARKLEDVRRDLILLTEQGKAAVFLTNTENAQKIDGLVEDIRDAMMDYQVRMSNRSFMPCPIFAQDLSATRYLPQ